MERAINALALVLATVATLTASPAVGIVSLVMAGVAFGMQIGT